MRALIFCLLISAVHAAQAQTCVETIPKTASKTSSTALAVGTVVAIAVGRRRVGDGLHRLVNRIVVETVQHRQFIT